MNCDTAREALSAQLDEESAPVSATALAEHLNACAACRRWLETAHTVTRQTRLAVVEPEADRTEELMAVAWPAHAERHRRRAVGTRLLLAAVAATELIVALLALLAIGHEGHSHAVRETGAFSLALAVGFTLAALRPARAHGMLALVGAASLALLGTAAVDLATGQARPAEEAGHLLSALGWLLLFRLARTGAPRSSTPGSLWRRARDATRRLTTRAARTA